MPKVLSRFHQKVQSAEIALLYYSGHGLQIHGKNYLVPVDASIETEIDVQFQTVRLDRILNIMQSGPKTSLVFLDACRDNPLARSLARSLKTRSSVIGRGLAQLSAEAGMLIAYATAPGTVASDGDNDRSPFTTAMLKHITTPDLDITTVLRRVRIDVMKETKNQQVPWTNSSLTDSFIFTTKAQKEAAETASQSVQAAPSNNDSSEQYAWNATTKVGTCSAYQHFASSYQKSFYAGLAKSWIVENCKKPAPEKAVELASLPTEQNDSPSRNTTVTSPPDTRELARSLQTELRRLGCLDGAVDGVWGAGSRRAAGKYNQYASIKIPVSQPSRNSIDTLRNFNKDVCPATFRPPPIALPPAHQPPIAQPPSSSQGHHILGKWNCQAKTFVFLAQPAFFQKKGKRVLVNKCHGSLMVIKSGKDYRSKFNQKCREKSLITFGTPPLKSSWIKSKLWFKSGTLYGQAYRSSLKNKMMSGWNPVGRFALTNTSMKTQVHGFVTDKGVKYRFKTKMSCNK